MTGNRNNIGILQLKTAHFTHLDGIFNSYRHKYYDHRFDTGNGKPSMI